MEERKVPPGVLPPGGYSSGRPEESMCQIEDLFDKEFIERFNAQIEKFVGFRNGTYHLKIKAQNIETVLRYIRKKFLVTSVDVNVPFFLRKSNPVFDISFRDDKTIKDLIEHTEKRIIEEEEQIVKTANEIVNLGIDVKNMLDRQFKHEFYRPATFLDIQHKLNTLNDCYAVKRDKKAYLIQLKYQLIKPEADS